MKYVLKPSLKHMTLAKIVSTLWNQVDVRILMLKFNSPLFYKDWQKIELRVLENAHQLSMPKLLKDKLLGLIKPIGIQILKWILYHSTGLYFSVALPSKLCWTSCGTIDKKKTAEVLVRDEHITISNRYKLACIYCLEDDILKLWKEIPEDLKRSFLHGFSFNEIAESSSDEDYQRNIVSAWSHAIKQGGWDNPYFRYYSIFKFSAKFSCKSSAEYFLQKLTPWQKRECLVDTAKYASDADILCFFLSQLEEEKQIKVFKSDPFRILLCFLYWPFQDFFIPTANCMWDFLSKGTYDFLLGKIIDKQTDGFKDWNYQLLFSEFWQISPTVLKRFVINKLHDSCLIRLFRSKDKVNSILLLKDASDIENKNLIDCDSVQNICLSLLRNSEWNALKFFIKECLSSRDEMFKFKQEFEERAMQSSVKGHLVRNKHKWDQLFFLSDDLLS